jgi:hypothetical protein
MNVLRAFVDSQPMLSLGWTLVLALWQTAILALVVWSWRRMARQTPAARRYAFAWGGLLLALALGSTTLWRLGASDSTSPWHGMLQGCCRRWALA